jgi:hypothetical protein
MTNAGTYRISVMDVLADAVAHRVFRTDLSRPGFAFLDLGSHHHPQAFREWLVELCRGLDRVYQRDFGRRIHFRAIGRFDQQVTTEAHLDGGPEESILVLGYEPSLVASRLFLLDYTRAANDRGLAPKAFLKQFNPMVRSGREMLNGYTTEVTPFRSDHFQVAVINNSSLDLTQRDRGMLGVLHKATIVNPDPNATRQVNSILLHTAEPDQPARHGEAELPAFIEEGASLSE